MKYDPNIHHRRSIRLKGYNYSQAGLYFVTICTQNHECLFGEVIQGEMNLNEAGQMVKKWYLELEHKFINIQCLEYVIMPNHLHSIIQNVGADLCVCPSICVRPSINSSLPQVMQWFKTMSTNEYIKGVKNRGWKGFNGKLWQRNYYEHIIRDESAYDQILEYIINNPLKWENDKYHVLNLRTSKM